MALQLGALALAAFRVPMAAHYPQPAEFEAVRVMLAAQFAALTLLCSSLLLSRGGVVITVATSWMMLFLASALAAWSAAAVIPAAGFLTLWIVALALACQAVDAYARAILSAAASLYVIGGGLLAYFHLEFSQTAIAHPELAFGPLFTAVSTPLHLPPLAWVEAASLDLIAILALGYAFRARTSAPHAPPPDRSH